MVLIGRHPFATDWLRNHRIAQAVSHQGTGVAERDSHGIVRHTPWTRAWHQRFSGAASGRQGGRQQHCGKRLISMGVWYDSVRNRQNEKTGAI
jgi:hypothetical protein